MRDTLKTLLLLLGCIAISGGMGYWFASRNTLSTEALATLLRETGDSAVVRYAHNVGAEIGALRDSISKYRAEAETAVELVIERDTIARVDTVFVPGPLRVPQFVSGDVPRNRGLTDTTRIDLPPVDSLGVHLEESLLLRPVPEFLLREVRLSFDPDTLTVALLAMPGGYERVVAHLDRGNVRVTDAIARGPRRRSGLQQWLSLAGAAACIGGGAAAAEGWEVGALIGLGACGVRELAVLLGRL